MAVESPAIFVPYYSPAALTINVPVVIMTRYVMVLRGATSLRGALEGVGPENREFFSLVLFGFQKSRAFQGPPLPMPRVMMLHPSIPLSISAIKQLDHW
jgi:hypothetical protein